LEKRRHWVTLTPMAEKLPFISADGIEVVQSDVPLAPLTSLDLGGTARHLAEVADTPAAVEAARWARRYEEPVVVLGGGSNVVVADDGVRGLVLRAAFRGVEINRDGDSVLLTAGAGEFWDEVVAEAVARGLAGIECLSGIPGLAGATPIQNVGAYGQEVGDVVERLRVLDLESLEERVFSTADCHFGYRSSVFRSCPGRYLVLEVTYRLRPGGAPTLAYEELRRAMATHGSSPGVADVREAVLDLRRSKSMVLDPADPNRRSAGSFFVNPVVDHDRLVDVNRRAREARVLTGEDQVPRFEIGAGRFKVPAGWLIEKTGFHKGLLRGPVGISSAHALALVHHGGGTAAQLVALAREIRDGVHQTFGITLRPEPVFLGFENENPLDEG
jgi:UDP-N-acetylmuramate dehydrogenase